MNIGSFDLAKRVFIIAEGGNCHEGSFERAAEMVKVAKKAGTDAIKFQTIVPEKLVSADQTERMARLKKFQLTQDQFKQLAKVAEKEGIVFLSTPFDTESAKFLNNLVPAFKIASGDITFTPLLETVASFGKPILLSTGGSSMADIKQALQTIGNTPVCLLHCVLSYPTTSEQANLQRINLLKQFDRPVGYSDHTLGLAASLAAVAMGARVIEKHFTLDKQLSDYRDHQLSADPGELTELVQQIRELEKMLGEVGQETSPVEQSVVAAVRRSPDDWLRHAVK